jgi:hypothetical protein
MFLFIDLDAIGFVSDKGFRRALKQICKNIAALLYDARALIIWSGYGYRIIITVNAKEALGNFEELTSYNKEPSKALFTICRKTFVIKQS